MVMGGDVAWGGEHSVEVMCCELCTETYIILLISVTPIHSIKKEKNRLTQGTMNL